METKNTPSINPQKKKWILIAIAAIAIIAIITVILVFASNNSDDKPSEKKASSQTSDKTDDTETTTDSALSVDNTEAPLLSIEDAPEPTLKPEVADAEITASDPEPEVEIKENQKTFNDCMETEDYEGAKEVLDNFFAVDDFSIAGENTYFNYVYYYEKQGLYEESALYQIDFLEREMGLDNIVAENTRYQKLTETLQYVRIDDPRLDKIKASVARWSEIQELLNNNKIDTAIEKLQGYIENGLQDCVYAYNYLAKAYGMKPDYVKQSRAYYIIILRMNDRELNTLEKSFKTVFSTNLYMLFNDDFITIDERTDIEDNVTADSKP